MQKSLFIAFIAIFIFIASIQVMQALQSSQSPVGTWYFLETFRDRSQGQELLSFSPDGRVLTTYFPLEGKLGSPRWGVWKSGRSGIDYTSYTLLSPDPASGFLRARCRFDMGVDGNTMTGKCAAELTDADGNITLLLTVLGITGKRLPLLPLE